MGFIAELQLVHEDLPLAPTIERRPDAMLQSEYVARTAERTFQFVSVYGGEYATLEDAMAADHTVSDPTRVATFEDRAIYRVIRETDLAIVPDRCAADEVFAFAITSADRGWTVRVHLPDRSSLSAFRTWCADRNVSFHVSQLQDTSSADDRRYALTERQREILLMAYYAGYFDIPRTATQEDLAQRLGISDSAVSQRVRRAVSELIAATIVNERLVESR